MSRDSRDSGRGGRDDDRGGRGRDDDRDRGGRDRGRDDGGRGGRDRDDRDSRGGRDEERGGRGGRDSGRDSGRGSGSSAGYSYQARGREAIDKRASMGANDFDKILKDHIKMWTPNKGDNRIRILPPTWPKPEHYGFDIWVHYGVGADRGTYLCLDKMLGKPDPIVEELNELKRTGDASDDEIKKMQAKRRVLVFIIDRDDEKEGVQAWAMPWTLDKDISVLSVDKSTGEVLPIDDPEQGYDVEFVKEGEKERTKYVGLSVARRSNSLGPAKWLDYAIDNPLPDQLQYFTYDEIAKVFGGGGAHRGRSEDGRDDRQRDSGRDGGSDDRSRDHDDSRSSREEPRGRDDGRGRDRDDTPSRSREDGASDRGGRGGRDDGRAVERDRGRSSEKVYTWDEVHGMTADELDALCGNNPDLSKINPTDAATDAELADWICEDLNIKKVEAGSTRRRVGGDAAPESDDRLARMREERESRRR